MDLTLFGGRLLNLTGGVAGPVDGDDCSKIWVKGEVPLLV